MRTDLFDYELPPHLIAQTPMPRGESRLLVLHRTDGHIEHRRFRDLPEYLLPGDTLVMNDTRVSARRLAALRQEGGDAEALLLRWIGETRCEALVRPGRALKPGRRITFPEPPPGRRAVEATVVAVTPEGGRILEVVDATARGLLENWGAAPLPPYIRTPLSRAEEARYQTVYAASGGSAAAPTAGLHFTPEMLDLLSAQGIEQVMLSLEVGIDTFRPVRAERIEEHTMHGERISLSAESADRINATRGRIAAVGTTSVRALESAAFPAEPVPAGGTRRGRVAAYRGETHLFITPGYTFRMVEMLLTNFHLPRSTLLMLVSAFGGPERVLYAYREAVRAEYRFFSFGDAMLLL